MDLIVYSKFLSFFTITILSVLIFRLGDYMRSKKNSNSISSGKKA